MSLQGINAYTSNLMYGSFFNNKPQSGNNAMSLMQGLNKQNQSQNSSLRELMEKVDLTRSSNWRKSMMEEYRKIFNGENAETNNTARNNELSLSDSSKKLSDSIKELMTSSSHFSGDNAGMQNKIKEFVSNYNDTVEGLKDSQSMSALRSGVSMVSTSAAHSRSLSNIGITIGADNKMTLNEDKFKSASKEDFSSLFSGHFSYGSKVADRASAIDRNAQIQANTYNLQGRQQNNFGVFDFNAIFSKSF
ncbi:MAG: flagellar filament capping protein FliD [Oscillospiraceae bacterium]|nr:flagellar filament capping protein FliD [Oscillospiraceae bacterium]